MGVRNCFGAFRSRGRFLFRQMDKHNLTKSLKCILLVFMSPIALLILVLLALLNLLRFLLRVASLFVIVAITTPFAVMYNVSILVVEYYFQQYIAAFKKSDASSGKPSASHWNWSDPRASVGTDVQILVSDFLKTVAAELLVAVSTGVITFYMSPSYVFYVSMTVGVAVVFHKWLNTDCFSKIALACLCGGYGLNPMMILFSFIGLFDIGGHPVAKCSFTAKKAFLFVEDDTDLPKDCTDPCHGEDVSQTQVEDGTHVPKEYTNPCHEEDGIATMIVHRKLCSKDGEDVPQTQVEDGTHLPRDYTNPCHQEYTTALRIAHWELSLEDGEDVPQTQVKGGTIAYTKPPPKDGRKEQTCHHRFSGMARSNVEQALHTSIDSFKWNAFERGWFQLIPKIMFTNQNCVGKYILESFMVLKFLDYVIYEYPMERLELHEDYSKPNELYHFLVILFWNDAFATDKLRGRYEQSLTLLQITEGVEKNAGFKIVYPKDKVFVVSGCTN